MLIAMALQRSLAAHIKWCSREGVPDVLSSLSAIALRLLWHVAQRALSLSFQGESFSSLALRSVLPACLAVRVEYP